MRPDYDPEFADKDEYGNVTAKNQDGVQGSEIVSETDKWTLIKVKDIKWQQDKSGYYCLINALPNGDIRLDILTSNHSPAISFEGKAENVRKTAMRYADEQGWTLSAEHAAYIGFEIARAENLTTDYIQD